MLYPLIGKTKEQWMEAHIDRYLFQEKVLKEGHKAGKLYCTREQDGRITIHDSYDAYKCRWKKFDHDSNRNKYEGFLFMHYCDKNNCHIF